MNKVEVATRIRSTRGVPDWADAACKGSDPELFFPSLLSEAAAAKMICKGCTERAACLRWALSSTQIYGIWGGMTEDERRELRRLQRIGNDYQ